MAKEPAAPATKSVTLTNTGGGSRSFWTSDRENKILRPGEAWSGDILAADADDLHSDISTDAKAADAAEPSAAAIQQRASDLVKGNELEALQTMAKSLSIKDVDMDDRSALAVAIAQAEAQG